MTTKTPEVSSAGGAISAPAQNVVQAICRVMTDVRSVSKDGRFNGGGVSYNFRGVDGVVNALAPSLRKHGVVVVPHNSVAAHRDVTTSGGKASREATVTVNYRVYGPAGVEDFIDVEVPGEALDSSDKGTAKAMSVAFRIALLQTFALPTEDKDPDDERIERDKPAPAPVQNTVSLLRVQLAQKGRSNGFSLDDLETRAKEKFRRPIASLSEAQLKTLLDDLPDPDPA